MAENSPPQSIIEGTVKFRDGKKWKSRWCVMRKLSPVADCVHLQLYKDAKERQKNGHTKCSLSLQHYVGYESGFTLDKESNTLAILCEDVVPVLAFDTRELLMQWRVKVQHNLGSSREYNALLISAPSGSGVRPGTIRLHYRETKLALSTGRPPVLALIWDVKMLRRYGMVDGKLCIEGGSRSGRGAGLFVIAADKGRELSDLLTGAALDQTAGSRLSVASRCGSVFEKRLSESASCAGDLSLHARSVLPAWNIPSSHTHNCLSEAQKSESNHPTATIKRPLSLARCTSCIVKIPNALSRSSTMPTTPGSMMSPSWIMDNISEKRSDSDRMSMCSRSSGSTSDYSVPRSLCATERSFERTSPIACCTPKVPVEINAQCCAQPVKCSCKRKLFCGPYENYDVPKAPMPLIQEHPSDAKASLSYYDTPKRLMRCLQKDDTTCECTPQDRSTATKSNEEKIVSESMDAETLDSHSNYVNITPNKTEKDDCGNYANIDIDNFESSIQILRSAGFSQQEIEELDEIPENEDSSTRNSSVHPSTECCAEHLNYMHMDGIDSASTNSDKAFSDVLSRISHLSDPSTHTSHCLEHELCQRRTMSAEFGKKLDVCDLNHFSIHGDSTINFMGAAKNDSTYLKNSPEECKDVETNKIGSSLVARFRDSVKIRRSCSVPSKTLKNRDSSSSNDSGVSTGSFKHTKCEFGEFEVPITTWKSNKKHFKISKKHRRTIGPGNQTTFFKEISSEPLKHISFRFDEVTTMTKSSLGDTDTLTRRNKPKGIPVDVSVRDSHVTTHSSSSDTSDYMESLSLSSLSSADATPSRHAGRPRSGGEYLSLDRTMLAVAACNVENV